MPEPKEVLPKSGLVVSEKSELQEVLCKPKIIPLKSITLQKLEEMEVRLENCRLPFSAMHLFPRMGLGSTDTIRKASEGISSNRSDLRRLIRI